MAPPNLIPAVNLVNLASQHVGQGYILGIRVPLDNPNWTGPWNCSYFASWLVYQTSRSLYGCERDFGDPSTATAYTGYWQRDAQTLGQIISIEQATATPGAFLLRFPPPNGGVGHIVVSDGTGGTFEAHGQASGVIKGAVTLRRWDTGVQVPGYSYAVGAAIAEMTMPQTLRLTVPPISGSAVIALQKALVAAGFDPGVRDGIFGPHTGSAVVAFQATHGLTPDGEAGPITLAALGLA